MESCLKNDSVFIQIDRVLQQGSISTDSLSSSIFTVPHHLREINQAAYEPQAISIGPYHHGKDHLKAMEVYKLHYLKTLLNRTNQTSVEKYATALNRVQVDARRYYSEPLDHIGDEKFVLMMLLDGCFVVELIRKSAMVELRGNDDPLLTHYILRTVLRDLLLVENQLPFFILSELFQLTVTSNDPEKNFFEMAIDLFFKIDLIPGSCSLETRSRKIKNNRDVKHLLGLLHDQCVNFKEECSEDNSSMKIVATDPAFSSSAVDKSLLVSTPVVETSITFEATPGLEVTNGVNVREPQMSKEVKEKLCVHIPPTTELNESGIKFQKIEGKSLFDMTFDKRKGVIFIPTLEIRDETESILRNLVAYEQCCIDVPSESKRFTEYITVMDCLINTETDVELLRGNNVIENELGDHKVVAEIFNRIRDYVLVPRSFCYAKMFEEVNEYCNRDWNRWMANLRHNYFNTPWALISFIAAIFLLLLTVMDSVYTVLSYHFA